MMVFLRLTKRFFVLSFLLIVIAEGVFAGLDEQQRRDRSDDAKKKAWNPATPCDPNPCQNKGRCVPKRKNYYCECGSDFAGDNCEMNIGNKEAFREEVVKESNLDMNIETTLYHDRTFVVGPLNYDKVTLVPEGRFGAEGLQKMRLGYTGKTKLTMGGTYMGCAEEDLYVGDVIGSHKGIRMMTVEMCLTLCRYKRFTYAGLSNGIDCQCRNYYNPSVLTDERQCARECAGNRSQICGGVALATRITSIWTSCPMGFYGSTCRFRCRCALYQCNIDDGTCPTNACKVGWRGNSCEDLDIVSYRTATACWIMIAGFAAIALFVTATGSFFITAFKLGHVEWTKGNFQTMLKVIKGQQQDQQVVYSKQYQKSRADEEKKMAKKEKKGKK